MDNYGYIEISNLKPEVFIVNVEGLGIDKFIKY